jgi:hypothetical protein
MTTWRINDARVTLDAPVPNEHLQERVAIIVGVQPPYSINHENVQNSFKCERGDPYKKVSGKFNNVATLHIQMDQRWDTVRKC